MPDLQALSLQVLMGGFVLAAAFGAIAQRTHFCTMGAVSDIVVMGDWTRMRMWLLAIGVAMVGFNAMVWLGWVDPASSLYGGTRFMWLSALVGGAMFGFGMVFASGCASKTLVRVGGGNLKALVVAIVLGLSAIATLKGLPAVARVASVDTVYVNLPAQQDLPSLAAHAFGASRAAIALALGALMGGGLIAWRWRAPKDGAARRCWRASASARSSSPSGGCRACSALSRRTRTRLSRPSLRRIRGAWSRSPSSRRSATRSTG